jgi:hypothetical protein
MPQPYALITITAGLTQEVVAAVPGKRICVLHAMLTTDTDCSITWKSGTTIISGPVPVGAQGGYADTCAVPLIGDTLGLFETAAGEALNLVVSASSTVGGHLTYILKNG